MIRLVRRVELGSVRVLLILFAQMDSQQYRELKARRPRDLSAQRNMRRRMPSTSGYMVAASAAAGALFFVLWWMLQGDENPWIPAGLAASVVMLVAASAREVIMRRAWTRYMLDDNRHEPFDRPVHGRASQLRNRPNSSQTEAFRFLEIQSADADKNDALPEGHLRVFELCDDFLVGSEKALASPALSSERRLTVRARQERVRTLQKHHLLAWVRVSARTLTHEAQQRARLTEKIETANRALDCIHSALKKYPEEDELNRSAAAVRHFITSSRVAHWVELAQRASFKGRYRRAIDCYRDALFYLTRADPTADHQAAAEQITREIEMLRARMATHRAVKPDPAAADGRDLSTD